jgi:hypothetical protein
MKGDVPDTLKAKENEIHCPLGLFIVLFVTLSNTLLLLKRIAPSPVSRGHQQIRTETIVP